MLLQRNSNKGFTVIELLAVITIIGIFSSIAVSMVNNAREKARDTRRKSDLIQLKLALEFYYDTYGSFPVAVDDAESSNGLSFDIGFCSASTGELDDWDPSSGLQALVTNNYIRKLPVDPVNEGEQCYKYSPNTNLQGACVWTRLEGPGKRWIGAVAGLPDPGIPANPYLPGYRCNFLDQVMLGGINLNPPAVCGNNLCESGEDSASCPADCVAGGPICGNNICEVGEAAVCPIDCGGGTGGT